MTRKLLAQNFELGEYINPDDIAATLAGAYDERVLQAQKIADARRDSAILEKRSFSFETVMSHKSKLEIMHRAREAGFYVTLFFVGVEDPRINIARVASRVATGGHAVPEDRIVQRYFRTMALLPYAVTHAHAVHVFDNSSLAAAPRHVVSLIEVKTGNQRVDFKVAKNVVPNWVRRYLIGERASEV